ncbi:MAG: FadR family transcriptional regulator [Motiliproteus sp.]|nr:FadR family transcriptional regulator [Motiliproteus sp.]MCW9052263.1 FadR family transcriptional regulator [Motiliproteus sp.]
MIDLELPAGDERIADRIARRLQGQILAGEIVPGEKLPSQRKLAGSLGVSREAVREAVVVLQNHGLIETYHGGGSFCKNLFDGFFELPMRDQDQNSHNLQCQVMEMREVLEGEAAYFAALRATDNQRQRLTAEYQRMLERGSGETTLKKAKADLTFHMLIAESSHHFIVMSISQVLYNKYFNAMYGVLSKALKKSGNYPPKIGVQHDQIYQAIMDQDAGEARKVAQQHIRYTRDQMLD